MICRTMAYIFSSLPSSEKVTALAHHGKAESTESTILVKTGLGVGFISGEGLLCTSEMQRTEEFSVVTVMEEQCDKKNQAG